MPVATGVATEVYIREIGDLVDAIRTITRGDSYYNTTIQRLHWCNLGEMEISPLQELFIHRPEFGVIICRKCAFAVIPQQVDRHIKDHHPSTKARRRTAIVASVEATDAIARRPIDVLYPDPDDSPIAGLPLFDNGLQCWDCAYLCRTSLGMQQHCRANHHWVHCLERDERDEEVSNEQKQADNRIWEVDVTCQQFFQIKGWDRLFAVRVGDPIESSSSAVAQTRVRDEMAERVPPIVSERIDRNLGPDIPLPLVRTAVEASPTVLGREQWRILESKLHEWDGVCLICKAVRGVVVRQHCTTACIEEGHPTAVTLRRVFAEFDSMQSPYNYGFQACWVPGVTCFGVIRDGGGCKWSMLAGRVAMVLLHIGQDSKQVQARIEADPTFQADFRDSGDISYAVEQYFQRPTQWKVYPWLDQGNMMAQIIIEYG